MMCFIQNDEIQESRVSLQANKNKTKNKLKRKTCLCAYSEKYVLKMFGDLNLLHVEIERRLVGIHNVLIEVHVAERNQKSEKLKRLV